MSEKLATKYGTLKIDLFEKTNGIDTCNTCKTFIGSYVYCPVFNNIMKDENLKFDETGELNRCELFKKT